MKKPDWLKVGALCIMRDDRKVRIYALDAGGEYPVHGAVWDESEEHWTNDFEWTLDGHFLYDDDENSSDLTGPWPEQEHCWRAYLAPLPNGAGFVGIQILSSIIVPPDDYKEAPWLNPPASWTGAQHDLPF